MAEATLAAGVVGLAHRQEVGREASGHHLASVDKDVCGEQSEGKHTCDTRTQREKLPHKHADAERTTKAAGWRDISGPEAVRIHFLLLTDEANDAAHQRVEVTTVSGHDGLLLSQQSFPGRLHHVHGHFTDEDLRRKPRQERKGERERRRKQEVKGSAESEADGKDLHADANQLKLLPFLYVNVQLQAPPITEGCYAQVATVTEDALIKMKIEIRRCSRG